MLNIKEICDRMQKKETRAVKLFPLTRSKGNEPSNGIDFEESNQDRHHLK